MIHILLSGCYGQMGQMLVELIDEQAELMVAGGVDNAVRENPYPFPVVSSFQAVTVESDVIIDFSHHSLFPDLLEYVKEKTIPVVIGTTGIDEAMQQQIQDIAQHVPIFRTGNMSLGVNLLIDLVKKAAGVLQDAFDVEIIEKHHHRKVDAPSGTALMIAENVQAELNGDYTLTFGRYGKAAKREKQEIGIHAVRGGTIVGEHSVIFAGTDEVLEIRHAAGSRKLFASGALKAAAFLVNQENGLYSMADVLM